MKKFLGQFLALVLLTALAVWMYSGLETEPPAPESVEAPVEDNLTRVAVTTLSRESVSRSQIVNGETRHNRQVSVRAQMTGTIAELPVEDGDRLEDGQVIARLESADLPDQLSSAEALERQREEELSGVNRLVERGLQNRTDLRAAQAAYQQAVASRRAIEEQLERLTITAPFGGIAETVPVTRGTYVSPGTEVLRLLDYAPLKAHARVSEADIADLEVGGSAFVTLVSGESFEATITQIASQADPATRTFDVVVTATEAAPEKSGITAEIEFALDSASAHFVSPALLTLDDRGNLALKHVNEDDRVVLTPVEMVRSSTEGVWVTGLPDAPRVITVGQGFVMPGENVLPVEASVSGGALIEQP